MKRQDLKEIKSKYKVFSENITDNLQKAKRLLSVSELTFSNKPLCMENKD